MDEVAAVVEETGLSQVERVVNVFVAPAKTFRDILRSASWWLPFVLLVASSLATAFVVDRKVGFDQVFENQVRQSQKAQDRLAELMKAHLAGGGLILAASHGPIGLSGALELRLGEAP